MNKQSEENLLGISSYKIHGDNIVECTRTFQYVLKAIKSMIKDIAGPYGSVTCPSYEIELHSGYKLLFTFLPGFGERRWNQDILGYVRRSGGRLREATDSIVTEIKGGSEKPIFAMEFCGALPAGNNAWQRQGRAFSFSHSRIPYFFLAELGGFELTKDRKRKAERLPNPALPFSFFSMTHYSGSTCLPVYEASPGAKQETISRYRLIFGIDDFLDYVRLVLTNKLADSPIQRLREKCIGLVKLLTQSKVRQDGLTVEHWNALQKTVEKGQSITEYLASQAPIAWQKVAYIKTLTPSAREFMEFAAEISLGLTSKSLPLSFIPRARRPEFAAGVSRIYPNIDKSVAAWLATTKTDLVIAWVMGFKPKGDDARPDRGLPPLARMLIGDNVELLSFIYGPAPVAHWKQLIHSPIKLGVNNGLWEAIFGVSDALLLDSATMTKSTPRALMKRSWDFLPFETATIELNVNPMVLSQSEQDVDTALHVIFASFGPDIIFEGMCNPPGGDWSGVSFIWSKAESEYRWLTLPRVSALGAKRPDHIFGIFGLETSAICLCVESKERPQSLESGIGPRLTGYTKSLFSTSPSIYRQKVDDIWVHYDDPWILHASKFISMGAYIADLDASFEKVPSDTGLDILCGFTFSENTSKCIANVRALTKNGQCVLDHIIALASGNHFVVFKQS